MEKSEALVFRIAENCTATVSFEGKITQEAIRKLIRFLELGADVYPSVAQPEEPEAIDIRKSFNPGQVRKRYVIKVKGSQHSVLAELTQVSDESYNYPLDRLPSPVDSVLTVTESNGKFFAHHPALTPSGDPVITDAINDGSLAFRLLGHDDRGIFTYELIIPASVIFGIDDLIPNLLEGESNVVDLRFIKKALEQHSSFMAGFHSPSDDEASVFLFVKEGLAKIAVHKFAPSKFEQISYAIWMIQDEADAQARVKFKNWTDETKLTPESDGISVLTNIYGLSHQQALSVIDSLKQNKQQPFDDSSPAMTTIYLKLPIDKAEAFAEIQEAIEEAIGAVSQAIRLQEGRVESYVESNLDSIIKAL